jgi:hypothetical protein
MPPLERQGTTRFVILHRSSVKVSSWKVLRLLLISNRDNTEPVAPLALRRGACPLPNLRIYTIRIRVPSYYLSLFCEVV